MAWSLTTSLAASAFACCATRVRSNAPGRVPTLRAESNTVRVSLRVSSHGTPTSSFCPIETGTNRPDDLRPEDLRSVASLQSGRPRRAMGCAHTESVRRTGRGRPSGSSTTRKSAEADHLAHLLTCSGSCRRRCPGGRGALMSPRCHWSRSAADRASWRPPIQSMPSMRRIASVKEFSASPTCRAAECVHVSTRGAMYPSRRVTATVVAASTLTRMRSSGHSTPVGR